MNRILPILFLGQIKEYYNTNFYNLVILSMLFANILASYLLHVSTIQVLEDGKDCR